MKDLGMEYKTMNECPNDSIIYYGEGKVDLKLCPKCKISRYFTNKVTKDIPQKVLCYAPSLHVFNDFLGART
jgi:hypothetical protein